MSSRRGPGKKKIRTATAGGGSGTSNKVQPRPQETKQAAQPAALAPRVLPEALDGDETCSGDPGQRPAISLRRLLDHMPDVIALLDRDQRVLYVNQTVRSLFGVDRSQLLGRMLLDADVPEKSRREWQALIDVALREGRSLQFQRSPTFSEGKRHCSIHISPLPGPDGSPEGAIVVSRDITELYETNQALKATEERLLESEARYRSVVEDQTETVSRFLPDGTLTFVNDVYCRFFGRPRSEIIGSRWHPTAHPDDLPRIEEALNELRPDNSVITVENRVYDGGGRERWMEFVNRGFFDDKGALCEVQCVGRDITVRKQLESERQILEAQKMESLGMLAGGIAHDFNNLLTSILGSAALARSEVASYSEVNVHLDRIEMATQRAAELCRQLLAYAGKGRLSNEAIDLNALIQDVLSLLKMTISKKAVLHLEITPGLPHLVGDATQLRQILMNLVINASDAIGNKSGLIIISTGLVRCDRAYLDEYRSSQPLSEGDYVYLEVRDNGCGMSPETRSRIFEPFFTTKFTGRGLGLSAVLGIVRSHKAGIKVYSELGKGSSFKMLFPVVFGAAATAQPGGRFARYRGHGKVMVVDDEESVRAVTARILETFGFQVTLAEDGRDCLEKLLQNREPLRFILMDLTMPHLSGEEALRHVRAIRPDLPIILMSGFSPEELQLRFGGKGFAGFLQKPFRPSDLMDLLERTFGMES
jgi:PAS domain S-box-containing protein